VVQPNERRPEAAIVIFDRAGAIDVDWCAGLRGQLFEIHFLAMEMSSAVVKRMHGVTFNPQSSASRLTSEKRSHPVTPPFRRRKSNPPNEIKNEQRSEGANNRRSRRRSH